MAATGRLAAVAGLIAALGGLAYVWHRSNGASPSLDRRLGEIFRPAPAESVPCDFSTSPRPLMILVLGQSNAGNHSALRPQSGNGAKTTFFFEGKCYRTNGSAPGATGRGGNIWTALGPRLAATLGRSVVFSVLAVDATRIDDWVGPGSLQRYLNELLIGQREHSFVPDVVLWQQGEADARAGTTGGDYRARLVQLIALLRSQGVAAPVLVALSTRCRNDGSEQIRAALKEAAAGDPMIRLGPDTDGLTGPSRSDGCHFSISGLDAAATLWESVVMASLPPSIRLHSDQSRITPPGPRPAHH